LGAQSPWRLLEFDKTQLGGPFRCWRPTSSLLLFTQCLGQGVATVFIVLRWLDMSPAAQEFWPPKEGRDKERNQGSPEWLRGRKERRMKDGHSLKAVVDRLLH